VVTLEVKRIGKSRRVPNKLPWEEAAEAASHSTLFRQREGASTQEEQDRLAPYEHRAFAREAVAETPALAVPIAVATPLYQVAKLAGVERTRSKPSLKQVTEGYKGIGEGLEQAAKKPWEEAQEAVSQGVMAAEDAIKSTVKAVRKRLMPWEEAQQTVAPPEKETPTRFEEVFKRLTRQESGDRHTDAKGNLTTSPVGAKGITQVMPKTGTDPGYGVEPLKDQSKEEYLRFGKDYLQAMLTEFDGDYKKAVAAYNFGPGGVKKAISKAAKDGGDWVSHTPAETKDYIIKVLGKSNG
jgi:soluble lytic murein transglycosylase-like protein